MHIAGMVVRTRPALMAEVRQRIGRLAGTEVHATSPEGRLVVTIEGDDRQVVADMIGRLDSLEGVLSASLAYEQTHDDSQPPEAPE